MGQKMSSSFDVIIIGSGIGGAAAGALLAHAGYKTLVLEKNNFVGGRCTSYEKDGFTVDVGVHLFGVGDKGSLGDICRKVGTPDAIDWVTIEKPILRVGNEIKKYSRANMIGVMPEKESEKLGSIFLKINQMTDEEIDQLWYVPLDQWVNQYTTHPQAHDFFDMINGQYFCVELNVSSTAEFIRCFKEVLVARSSAYPKGGCIAIPKAYLAAVEKHGGQCIVKAPVKKVIVENGTAVGVRLEDGREFRAPIIISNADIKTTIADLVGKEHFPADYAETVRNLTYSYHAIGLKVGLKEKITDDQLLMYRPYAKDEESDRKRKFDPGKMPELVGGMVTIPTNYDPSLAPAGKQMIFYGSGAPAKDDWKKWEKVLMDSFFSVYPQAKDKVLWSRLDTPEFVDSIAGETGNIIGVGQTVTQIHKRRPSVVTPLKGLYLASAEAGGHGIGTELAADSARELFEVLTKDKRG
jgi:phytoene dehydrogenase-like protein